MKTLEELGIRHAPWKPISTLSFESREVVDRDSNTVCVLDCLADAKGRKANAQLIAAAPKLYEELAQTHDLLKRITETSWILDAREKEIGEIHDAIYKAELALNKAGGAE